MPRLEQWQFDSLVTRHTSVRSHVQVLEIAHPGCDPVRVRVIRPRMAAQPSFSRPVATFTRNTFTRLQTMRRQWFRNLAQRRMASGAPFVGGWIFDLQRVRYLLRPRRGQSRERALRMKVAHRPGQELVFLAAAM